MEKKNAFSGIQGLRGIAIIIIVLYHTYDLNSMGNTWTLSIIKKWGDFFGNYIFFMMSGFLMAYFYRERIEKREVTFFQYFIRRIVKIYPLYIITNIIVLLQNIIDGGIETLNITELLLVLFMQAGGALEDLYPYNIVTWFICTLVICYCVYYVITYISPNDTVYFIGIVCEMIWGYILINRNWNFPYSYNHTGEGMINFCLGCLLAWSYLKLNSKNRKMCLKFNWCMLIMLAILELYVGFDLIAGDIRIVIIYLVAPTMLYLSIESNLVKWIMNLMPIKIIGTISMSIYFWHTVLGRYLYKMFPMVENLQPRIQYLCYWGMLLVWSGGSYWLIERKLGMFLEQKMYKEKMLRS